MVSAVNPERPGRRDRREQGRHPRKLPATKNEIEALQAGGGGGGGIDTSGTIAVGAYARFVDANTVEGLSAAALMGDIDALLPDRHGELPGGRQRDHVRGVHRGRRRGWRRHRADGRRRQSATAVTIGAATTGTQRSMLSDSAITATLAANCPAGTVVRLIKSGNGLITVACQGAQAAGNGAGYYTTGDDQSGTTKATASASRAGARWSSSAGRTPAATARCSWSTASASRLPTVVTGSVDFTAAGITVPNGAAVSGALTKALHGGGVYKTSGNCTITPAAGFTVTLLLGGAHTIGAGGTAHTPASATR